MATNYFERQESARHSTGWLLIAFAFATIAVVASIVIAVTIALSMQRGNSQQLMEQPFPWDIPVLAGAATLLLILGGSFFKVLQLRSGGGAFVAEQQGGIRIYPDDRDPMHRRILNIVEEMAIASGTPVPPVYFLPNEPGINAFAAGYSPSDAVVAVTRGAAEELTREELQGVIAHEFSHVVNGDMKIGIRLMGVMHGILLLGLVGQLLFRTFAWSGGMRSRRDSNSGNSAMAFMLFAIALIVLGFIGTFLGNIIKAAVSRQRERLADASGVQFTRNPAGLAGALKRIGALEQGSKLLSPNAAEASHIFFAEGVWSGLATIWSTHPPLADRIRELDPSWDGTYPEPHAAARQIAAEFSRNFSGASFAGESLSQSAANVQVPLQAVGQAVRDIGTPSPGHFELAASLVGLIPSQLVTAAHEPYAAKAIVFCLLLHSDSQLRSKQLQELSGAVEPGIFRLVQKLIPMIDGMDVRGRIPLVDMAIPALASMSAPQYASFRDEFAALVRADGHLDLFEWVLAQIVERHLRPRFERVSAGNLRYSPLSRLSDQCAVVLSTVVRAGANGTDVQQNFDAGAACLPELSLRRPVGEAAGLNSLQRALNDLQQAAPADRGRVVDACSKAISGDSKVTLQEAELLRGISDLLGCPMPPLLWKEITID